MDHGDRRQHQDVEDGDDQPLERRDRALAEQDPVSARLESSLDRAYQLPLRQLLIPRTVVDYYLAR